MNENVNAWVLYAAIALPVMVTAVVGGIVAILVIVRGHRNGRTSASTVEPRRVVRIQNDDTLPPAA